MKFRKKDLQDLVYEGDGLLEKVEDKVMDNSRWAVQHKIIFKDTSTGKHYSSYYSVGATEMQDEDAYEWAEDDIECFEVELKTTEVKQWVEVKEMT